MKVLPFKIPKPDHNAFVFQDDKAIEFYDKAQVIDPNLKEIPLAKSRLFEKLNMPDDAFLAAQGVLNKDMEKIKSDAKSLWRAISNKFRRSASASTVKENGLDNHPATGERASSPRIPATLFQPQEEHGQGQQDPATH